MCATVFLVGGTAIIGKSISASAQPTNSPHVMVVMMENKNFSEVIGAPDQPYTNGLATANGLATHSFATVPGSLPNYLAIVSGSTQGTDNVTPSQVDFPNTATVADQLNTSGYSAKAYAEDLPADPTNTSGNYSILHFPWPYFPNAHITVADASSLLPDLNSTSAPDFVWYTPNVINDEDAGTAQQGDAFLANFIPQVQATSWYQAGGQIIIEWDESDNDTSGINGASGGGGRIPTIVVSAALAASPRQDSTPVDTIGILRSIEDVYGLPYLDFAANAANGTIDALLTTASSPATTTTTTTAATTTTTTAATTTTTAPAATTTTTAPAATTTTTAPAATTTTTAPAATTTTTTGVTPTTTRPVATGAGSATSPPSTAPRRSTATSTRSSSPGTVTVRSSALALTGPDKGLGVMVLIGVALIVFGLALFAVDHVARRRRLGVG